MAKEKQPDSPLVTLGAILLAAVILGIEYFSVALVFWAKKPLTRALRLDEHSRRWWRYGRTIQFIAAISGVLLVILLILAWREIGSTSHSIGKWIVGTVYVGLAFAPAALIAILHWMQAYALDPEIQKKAAGGEAEDHVRKLIEDSVVHFAGSKALHGVLLVFNQGSNREYSVEIDHLLVTRKRIYAIETKYKSGTIFALHDSPTWKVISNRGEHVMRNALKQAKNTARVLAKELTLPVDIVPIVTIYGADVTIENGPANVVPVADLIKTITAFENVCAEKDIINPPGITDRIQACTSSDPEVNARHIERAMRAQEQAEMEAIVRASSLN